MDENLILERYRLVERLAVGGSAEVWRATDEQLGRQVAVKRLHPHLLPDEPSRKRLAAEARAAAALSHPVVVGVYDVDATGEWPALVMELVDGESLAARIAREGPLPPAEAAAVVADVAEALFHAHQRGVIHRDVKPGNVLLSSDGRTRLVDFGIAHSLSIGAERLTLDGTVIGTLHAMAPEQLAGGPISPRTDLYGLGTVLHEALTGRPPYAATSPLALADAQGAGPPSMPGVDPALAAVIAACLAPDPANRPLHAGALAQALRDWLRGDPSTALALAPAAPADTSAITRPIPVRAGASESQAASAAPTHRERRASRWPVLALALATAVGVVVLLAVVNGATPRLSGDSASPTPNAEPTVTPEPSWLADLADAVGAACGEETAQSFEAEAGGLDEDRAEETAEGLIDACAEEDRRKPGKGNGRGTRGGDGDGD